MKREEEEEEAGTGYWFTVDLVLSQRGTEARIFLRYEALMRFYRAAK